MKQQVVVIHGAGGFVNVDRARFEEGIKNREVTVESLRRKTDWKGELGTALGDRYDVLSPRMPNADDPRYSEWKAWFEKIIPVLENEIIVVGHSLGGLFLAKYLSEYTLPVRIRGLFIVGAPYFGKERKWERGDQGFYLSQDLSHVTEQSEHIFLYYSEDDFAVPFEDSTHYKSVFPEAVVRTFSDRGHFRDDNLPGIVEDIKSLSYGA